MISVIIPTFNEEKHVELLLHQLHKSALIREIIVCDGGSSDNTERATRSFPRVMWTTFTKGRACQMNHGASLASQPLLLFLHADSSVERINFENILTTLKGHLAGSFYLAFDQSNLFLALYSRLSKINHPLLTYGDQGLFLRRKDFNAIGGFSNIEIMEDLDMVKKLRKLGPFAKVQTPLITSSRRFLCNGIIKQQLRNILLVMLYRLGFSPTFLSRFYEY